MSEIPERPSVLAVLASCSAFNALSEGERDHLGEQCLMAYAERGELIWLAGGPLQFAAICGTGFVKMTRTTPQGSEIAVELLGPGQCLGFIAALEGREYPLNAVAVTNTWYLKLPVRAIHDVYNSNSQLRDSMFRTLAPRLRRAHEMMARMSSGKVEQRLATVLMILMDSYGSDAATGTVLSVPLTRQDLAEMAGTTVETAIRVMSRWQKKKVLSTVHQCITLHRPEVLEALMSQ